MSLLLPLFLVNASGYSPVVVVGESMAPTFRNLDLVVMDRKSLRERLPSRGDIIVFRRDSGIYVKRVVAVESEVIEIVHYLGTPKMLLAEDSDLRETYKRLEARRPEIIHIEAVRVPPQAVFVMGDNANASVDSRDFGAVPVDSIVGWVHVSAHKLAGSSYALQVKAGATAGKAGPNRSVRDAEVYSGPGFRNIRDSRALVFSSGLYHH